MRSCRGLRAQRGTAVQNVALPSRDFVRKRRQPLRGWAVSHKPEFEESRSFEGPPESNPAVNLSGSVNQRAREFERVALGRREQPPGLLSEPEIGGSEPRAPAAGPLRSQTLAGTRVCAILPAGPRGARPVNQNAAASSRRRRKLTFVNRLRPTCDNRA